MKFARKLHENMKKKVQIGAFKKNLREKIQRNLKPLFRKYKKDLKQHKEIWWICEECKEKFE